MLRHELVEIADLAGRLLSSGTAGLVATLVASRGSSYRSLGSVMVGTPGIHAGGISGGCLEPFVVREGERATREVATTLMRFRTGPETDGDAPALGCGGEIEILVERLQPGHRDWLATLREAHEKDTASCAVYEISGTTSAPLVRRSIRAWPDRPSASNQFAPRVALHYIAPLTRLVIIGAGDDAQPLCSFAHSLGWHVSVIDRRARLAIPSRFPEADTVASGDWPELIEQTRFTDRTAVILMTHSLQDDAHALSHLLSRPAVYVGALGPAHRKQWLFDEVSHLLPAMPHGLWSRVRGPVGLDLGDRSAPGIAISVIAEVLAVLNARIPKPLVATAGDLMAPPAPRVCHA